MRAGVQRTLVAAAAGLLMVLAFQNCSDFALQDRVLYEQGLFDSRESMDAKLLPQLLNTTTLKKWSKPGQPNFVNSAMMADQFSVIIAADRTATGKLISVGSGTVEEGFVSIVSGKIRAGRADTSGIGYSEYKETNLPASGSKMVIAASFGTKAGDISLMVNGIVQQASITKSGTPGDFSLIAKDVTPAVGQLYEYIAYGGDSTYSDGKLSNQELNVMSRYIANNNMIENVIFDPSLIDGTGPGGGTSVNPKFTLAKAVFDAKCTTCHSPTGSYPTFNLVGLTESKAINNGWVVKGNPDSSRLYYRLMGSSGSNGPKTMPQGGSISAQDVQIVADWINSIQ